MMSPEHNLSKNVSKRLAFLWDMQIWTIRYGIYDMILKKSIYIYTLLICTLWYEFSNDLEGHSDFGKNIVRKSWSLGTILRLSVL